MLYPKTFRVNDPAGQPIAGAKVWISAPGSTLLPRNQTSATTLFTNASGVVVFQWNPDQGQGYSIVVSARGYLDTTTPALFLPTASPGETFSYALKRDPAAYFASWGLFLDADTRVPIVGAQVFVNDQAMGATNAEGKVWVTGLRGSCIVKVRKQGVYDYTSPAFPMGPTSVFPTPWMVKSLLVQPRRITFHTLELEGIQLAVSQADPIETLTTDKTGSATTTKALAAGLYEVVASKAKYTPQTTSVAVEENITDYHVDGPVLIEDGSTEGTPDPPADSPANTVDPSIAVVTPRVSPVLLEPVSLYDYEWVPPNDDHGKYFTTTQARMYVGNLFVDELNSVQFAYQANRVPVYGYASEDMDAVGSGRRLVQGQILINFISEGYLFTVLSEYQRFLGKQAYVNSERSLNATKLALLTQQIDERRSASVNEYDDELNRLTAEATSIAASDPQTVDDAKQVLVERTKLKTARNAITLKVPFTIELILTGAGRDVTRKLEDCVLTSNEQIYSQDGSTLLDAYGFIARRLI